MPIWFWRIAIWLLAAIFAAFLTKAAAFALLTKRVPPGKQRDAWALRILLIPFLGGLVYLSYCALGGRASGEKPDLPV